MRSKLHMLYFDPPPPPLPPFFPPTHTHPIMKSNHVEG